MLKRIESTEKDFQNRSKGYTNICDVFNELAHNQFYAPNSKNINLCFTNEFFDKKSFWFVNDGEPLIGDKLLSAISKLGCRSENTPGNENGVGLKTSASFFTKEHPENSFLIIFSKKDNEVISCGLITSKGEYGNYDDYNDIQKEFLNFVSKSFTDGTATCVFNTEYTREDVDNFLNNLVRMFTIGLFNKNFVSYYNGEKRKIEFFDRHYRDITSVENIIKDDICFHSSITNNKKEKKFLCNLVITNMFTIKDEYFDILDERDNDFGLFCGYDDGFMPIHIPNTELLSLSRQPQNQHVRASLVAKPIEGDEKCASISDWKIFYQKLGNISPEKVPIIRHVNYFYNGKLKKDYEGFYNSIIEIIRGKVSDWNPNSNKNKEDEFSNERMDELNLKLNKKTFKWCNETFKYSFKKDLESVIKFDNTNKHIFFNFSKESPLINNILKGGRSGRNGHNDLNVSIIPIIDCINNVIRMDNTIDKVIKNLKRYINSYNCYYY